MKYILLLLTLSMTLQITAATNEYYLPMKQSNIQENQNDEPKTIRWDYLSAGSGILGLALAFIPFLSIIGILLSIAAIAFSIMAFRKKQKNKWSWIGLIAGGLTVLVFLGVIGLMTFF